MFGFQDESIGNILIDEMEAHLQEILQGEVDDATAAGLVRAGKLQDDPTDFRLNILIHEGGEDWRDELNTEDDPVQAPIFEIGGREWWWRRFEVELILFFDDENNRRNARIQAFMVYSRVQHALNTMPIPTTADSWGEQAHAIQVRKGYLREGGGEGTFIWNGKFSLDFLTSLPKHG